MIDHLTDLAAEARDEYMSRCAENGNKSSDGISFCSRTEGGFSVSTIDILNEEGENALGKRRGRYITISFSDITLMSYDDFEKLCMLCASEIRALCEHNAKNLKSVLLCGLGNERMSPDALGPASAKNVLVTRHLKEQKREVFESSGLFDICAVFPDVSAHTGLDASDIAKAAAKSTLPDVMIAIDALAAREPSRLCTTLQLCSAGISPGSGVGNAKNAIDEKSMGVPVISIGVPTVINAGTLVRDIIGKEADVGEIEELFVCPKDIDEISVKLSKLIGYSVNRAFHGALSFGEMTMM